MRAIVSSTVTTSAKTKPSDVQSDELQLSRWNPAHGERCGTIAEKEHAKIASVQLARGRLSTDVRRDAANNQRVDAPRSQYELNVGRVKRAKPRLFDADIARFNF